MRLWAGTMGMSVVSVQTAHSNRADARSRWHALKLPPLEYSLPQPSLVGQYMLRTPQPQISSFESPGITLFGYTSTACLQFISKCTGDLGAAIVLADTPFHSQAGHLFQQSMEKAIKALLIHAGKEPPHTHPLEGLLDLMAQTYPSVGRRLVNRYRGLMEAVTPFAVRYRYHELDPAFSSTELEEFADLARKVRSAAWQFIQTHTCSGTLADTPFVPSWTLDAISSLAARFGKAQRWRHPDLYERRFLAWLSIYRHEGADAQRCCLAGIELGKTCATSTAWAPITDWWLLADGRVVGIDLPDDEFPPNHYVLPPLRQVAS